MFESLQIQILNHKGDMIHIYFTPYLVRAKFQWQKSDNLAAIESEIVEHQCRPVAGAVAVL